MTSRRDPHSETRESSAWHGALVQGKRAVIQQEKDLGPDGCDTRQRGEDDTPERLSRATSIPSDSTLPPFLLSSLPPSLPSFLFSFFPLFLLISISQLLGLGQSPKKTVAGTHSSWEMGILPNKGNPLHHVNKFFLYPKGTACVGMGLPVI